VWHFEGDGFFTNLYKESIIQKKGIQWKAKYNRLKPIQPFNKHMQFCKYLDKVRENRGWSIEETCEKIDIVLSDVQFVLRQLSNKNKLEVPSFICDYMLHICWAKSKYADTNPHTNIVRDALIAHGFHVLGIDWEVQLS